MVVAQATEPDKAVKALCLFGVLLLARILILWGRNVPLSFWSPVAYLWQDVSVVLLFAVLTRLTSRRPWIAWTAYGATTIYVALNLPLIRLMSSPMTLPMLRASRGALADSIRHHLTVENLFLTGSVLGAAILLPALLRQVKLAPPIAVGLGIASVVAVATGPVAASRVETNGLHRNVFFALLRTALARVGAEQTGNNDWRRSPLNSGSRPRCAEGLSRFKGAAQGRNVVLILLESTGAKYLRAYGATEDPMPNLTALANQAILFENAYAVYPESIKGLFSVLCSRYPAFDTEAEVCARTTTPSIASRLAEAGYRTALFHSGRFFSDVGRRGRRWRQSRVKFWCRGPVDGASNARLG
ncbi:MAG: hypothetical protein DME18_08490 [Verrucomicrobia bacterium]|nr:MAG: hypothetical protein DME18_08490 [Verrucomicrobiota bacterium]